SSDAIAGGSLFDHLSDVLGIRRLGSGHTGDTTRRATGDCGASPRGGGDPAHSPGSVGAMTPTSRDAVAHTKRVHQIGERNALGGGGLDGAGPWVGRAELCWGGSTWLVPSTYAVVAAADRRRLATAETVTVAYRAVTESFVRIQQSAVHAPFVIDLRQRRAVT